MTLLSTEEHSRSEVSVNSKIFMSMIDDNFPQVS